MRPIGSSPRPWPTGRSCLADLTQRRDRGLAQLRDLLAGRDVLVEAIDQVRMTAAGLIGNLDEITTAPTSFVSLDPSIEGPGDVLEEAASVAVTRERRAVKPRRPRAGAAAPGDDAAGPAATPALTPVPAARAAASQPEATAPELVSLDPITAEVPIIGPASSANGSAAH